MNAPVKYVGVADGPERFVPEFGYAVPTFSIDPGGTKDALTYHVPLEFRGDYRPNELANYDSGIDYRTDVFGRMLCASKTLAGALCSRRAVNRCPACDMHGGRLHPLDKLIKQTESAEDQSLSRYQQFKAGQLSTDDLDDEELAACGFRARNGSIYRPRTVSREMAQAFQRAIYERANTELRANTVEAARTMAEIMRDKHIEPDIRLKAANTIIERTLGKTPQVVALTDAKAYEQVFDDILHVRSERPGTEIAIIDGEVIDAAQRDDIASNGLQYKTTDDVSQQPSEDAESSAATNEDPGDSADDSGNARLFERNDAILAPVLEVPVFEYDLKDKTDSVKKATRKRYASRALGIDLNALRIPYIVTETPMADGSLQIQYSEPAMPKVPKPTKVAVSKRKSFTLKDFG